MQRRRSQSGEADPGGMRLPANWLTGDNRKWGAGQPFAPREEEGPTSREDQSLEKSGLRPVCRYPAAGKCEGEEVLGQEGIFEKEIADSPGRGVEGKRGHRHNVVRSLQVEGGLWQVLDEKKEGTGQTLRRR